MTQTRIGSTRTETDSLGELAIPADALWGIQTQRAVDNFPISGQTVAAMPELVRALADLLDMPLPDGSRFQAA